MTTEELCAEIERLDAAATAGPWKACGSERGGCKCGSVASIPLDAPIATATIGEWADTWPEIRTRPDGRLEAYTEKCVYGEIPDAAGKANAELIASYRTLAVEAAKKLREMQRRDEVLGKLIANPDWHRQMAGSIEFFENGGVGKTLADLGLE